MAEAGRLYDESMGHDIAAVDVIRQDGLVCGGRESLDAGIGTVHGADGYLSARGRERPERDGARGAVCEIDFRVYGPGCRFRLDEREDFLSPLICPRDLRLPRHPVGGMGEGGLQGVNAATEAEHRRRVDGRAGLCRPDIYRVRIARRGRRDGVGDAGKDGVQDLTETDDHGRAHRMRGELERCDGTPAQIHGDGHVRRRGEAGDGQVFRLLREDVRLAAVGICDSYRHIAKILSF